MKRVYVTVTRRVSRDIASQEGYWGSIVIIDWDDKQVIDQHWIQCTKGVYQGGSTGCRGLTLHNGRICVASAPNVIQFRDLDSFVVEDEFEVPDVSGVHQIQSHGGLLWITSTDFDDLVVLDGREVVERRHLATSDVQQYIHTWRHGDPGCRNKLHFNSISWSLEDHEVHLYSDPNIIYDATVGRLLWLGRPLAQPHDLCFVSPDEVVVNSSTVNRTFLLHIGHSNYRQIFFAEEQAALRSSSYAAAGWTRGLAAYQNSVFIGVSPGEIIEVDLHTTAVVGSVRFSDNLRETPFGILLDPRDWK